MGVPIAVEDDHVVGRLQVKPQPPRARGEEEHVRGAVRRVEPRDGRGAQVAAHAAVDAFVGEAVGAEVLLDDVQRGGELREDQRWVRQSK